MTVAVTGATGFLGGALTRRLLAEGLEVRALGRDPQRGAALSALGARFVPLDLEDARGLRAAVQGCDTVFHCAARSSPWGPHRAFYAANVLGTRQVVQACLNAGARLVHVSTPSLYFRYGGGLQVREDHPLPRPVNAYAATKRAAEHEVAAGQARGLEAVVLRPRALFGPGDTSVLPRLLAALERGRLPVIGSEDTVTDLTYIDNAVDALLLAARSAAAVGGTYNITNGEPVRLWPAVRRLADRLGLPGPGRRLPFQVAFGAAALLEGVHAALGLGEPVLTRYTVSVVARSATLDISAARRDLGYAPRVSVAEGLERFACAWEAERGRL
ncbi:nucleoside-diphosphate-sugar epimerase [Deinobacterium chartae]|uniref:Nucleoside-diphosphate-sugar epimerase n=1 Tax=Deinobacterium chartae TaxID=521158 RepID=A0A841I2S8_9DEIO|nr:nucleoside-diphosphate-sugar epimerase [Deinobacterium chartae]